MVAEARVLLIIPVLPHAAPPFSAAERACGDDDDDADSDSEPVAAAYSFVPLCASPPPTPGPWACGPERQGMVQRGERVDSAGESIVLGGEVPTERLCVKEPPKYPRWDDPDYCKWKDKERRILNDIELVVLLGKEILHSDRYMDGEQLTEEDEKIVVERLLAHHPHSEDKIGCGVDSIMLNYSARGPPVFPSVGCSRQLHHQWNRGTRNVITTQPERRWRCRLAGGSSSEISGHAVHVVWPRRCSSSLIGIVGSNDMPCIAINWFHFSCLIFATGADHIGREIDPSIYY